MSLVWRRTKCEEVHCVCASAHPEEVRPNGRLEYPSAIARNATQCSASQQEI